MSRSFEYRRNLTADSNGAEKPIGGNGFIKAN